MRRKPQVKTDILCAVCAVVMLLGLSACGGPSEQTATGTSVTGDTADKAKPAETPAEPSDAEKKDTVPVFEKTEEVALDPWQESAADGVIDFAAQYEIRPDIVGWLFVPGTDVDCPVFQSDTGEGASLSGVSSPEMIDFCSTMTAPAAKEGDPFASLYEFADPSFFAANGKLLYFQPYGTMVYAVMAAWETDNKDLSISLGGTEEEKQAFLDDLRTQEMGKNLHGDVVAGLTTSNFFLTLTAKTQQDAQKQFIVVGMLTGVE